MALYELSDKQVKTIMGALVHEGSNAGDAVMAALATPAPAARWEPVAADKRIESPDPHRDVRAVVVREGIYGPWLYLEASSYTIASMPLPADIRLCRRVE